MPSSRVLNHSTASLGGKRPVSAAPSRPSVGSLFERLGDPRPTSVLAAARRLARRRRRAAARAAGCRAAALERRLSAADVPLGAPAAAFTSCVDDRRDAAGRRRHQRRARRQRLHDRVGQPVHVARIVPDRGHHGDVGRRRGARRPRPARARPGRRTRSATPRSRARVAQFGVEIAAAADDEAQRGPARREAADRVDQVLEALLADEAARR